MLTDSRTAMKRQKGNVNKHGFWEKKKREKKKDNDSKCKNWFQNYLKIYSRNIVISGWLFKWNIKKNYWLSNRFKVKIT